MSIFDELDSYDEHEESIKAGFKHAPTKYCGNKLESLPFILPLLPHMDTFVDVFGGSGQVLFSRRRSKLEVYNDRHSGMSAFYRVLQNKAQMHEFTDRLDKLQHSRELFYAFKEEINDPEMDIIERALKWYYVVQVSFGGMGGNFGRVTKPDTPLYDKLHAYVKDFNHFNQRLQGVQIENLDWKDCIKDYDDYTTVFYLDPPYWQSNQYAHTMSKHDHRRMCDMIFDCKGFFALSGYANDVYDQYPWDDIHIFEVGGNFTPSEHIGKSRADKHKEYLWIKEAA